MYVTTWMRTRKALPAIEEVFKTISGALEQTY